MLGREAGKTNRARITGVHIGVGSEENAVKGVAERLYEMQAAGNVTVDQRGVFELNIMVQGELVRVQGAIVNGVIRIGNFWIPVK